MKKNWRYTQYLVVFPLILLLLTGCELFKKNDKKIEGCTDPTAYNYNSDADDDDGSCILECPKFSHFMVLSTDNGENWDRSCVFNNIGSQYSNSIWDISIIDENNIWMCTDNPATILYTSDSGLTWDVQYDDQSKTVFFHYLEMFDEFNGIAMGDGTDQPLLLNTNDGGMTWNEVTVETDIPGSSYKGETDFINPNVGFYGMSGVVRKTVDGGKTWTDTNYPNNSTLVVKFYDEDIGSAADIDEIYSTVDGGMTWQKHTLPESAGWPMALQYSDNDPSKIWFLGEESIWFSDNGGESFIKQIQFPSYKGNIQDMVIKNGYGWAIGYNRDNTCYKSSDPENGIWEPFDVKPENNAKTLYCIDASDDGIVVIPGYIQ